MKKITTTLILVLFANIIHAQNPLIKQWDYRFGGTSWDLLYSFKQTADGGYMLAGLSSSGIGGDKTQATQGGNDYWIVKIDALCNMQWDKDFGGTSDDNLFSSQQTSDGGYVLGGPSASGIGGDKTQATWGGKDYWIVKINSLGNIEWDKDFGGTSDDDFYCLHQTADGGYILGGASSSGISGDKTQTTWGGKDFWIVKIDALGIKEWDKDFGGTGEDFLTSVQQTADGGYILGGFSNSGISGDKTQATWGGAFDFDYWIVKTDSLGIKQWDKDFGGTDIEVFYSLQQTADRGFILGGYSNSGISGDKTQPSWGSSDFWIVKTDSLGIKQWDKDFGGTSGEDEFGSITQTSDGGYLVPGTSYSPASGDKTENNLGAEQTWIVKTDALGMKQWDKTLHTNTALHDETGYAILTSDGCYAMANCTDAGIGGDKTQPNWDVTNATMDFWIIKFCDSTLTSMHESPGQDIRLTISPNPFISEFSITIQKQNLKQATFAIKNSLGQTVFRKQENNLSNTYTKTIDLGFLSKGIYLLDVVVDGERIVKKIVKE